MDRSRCIARPAVFTRTRLVAGEPSWTFASDRVEAALTRDGGHLGPVTFHTASGPFQPFAVAPWAEDGRARPGGVLRMLRGDFFCMPFGAGAWRGENPPLHGETATARWRLDSLTTDHHGAHLCASLAVSSRPGRVTKEIFLRAGETNLYCRHTLSGFRGPMTFGHHATLAFAPEHGEGRLSLSPRRLGQVHPAPFENPAAGGYHALKLGATFRDLRRAPLAAGGHTDLSRYPAREGFEDIVLLGAPPPAPDVACAPGWAAVVFPRARQLWFALKDPRLLPSTVLWLSNGGRHYAPWNGRHRRVLGVEDVVCGLPLDLAASLRPGPFTRAGIPTVRRLDPRRPLRVPYIMGVAALPAGFDAVRRIRFARDHVVFHARSGRRAEHPVDLSFLGLSAATS